MTCGPHLALNERRILRTRHGQLFSVHSVKQSAPQNLPELLQQLLHTLDATHSRLIVLQRSRLIDRTPSQHLFTSVGRLSFAIGSG